MKAGLRALCHLAVLMLLSCGKRENCSRVGTSAEIENQINRLLSRMTLAEKLGQMNQLSAGGPVEEYAEAIRSGQVGSILNEVDPDKLNQLQRISVEESRLGIPLLVGRDIIHGFHTIFPIPLGLAATFDTDLAAAAARVSALEATAQGVRWTFSPMVDIARDPRWGRIAEGSGEDPHLTVRMGTAMVRGYQGERLDSTSMAACLKHYAAYGAAEGGRDYNSTFVPERLLRNVYLPPFEAAIKAGAMSVMTSFNDNDGVPSTGSDYLIRDILRNEWGFDGLVVTDWNSMGEMLVHGFAADQADAACKALNAGVDMDMQTRGFISCLSEAVQSGNVKMSQIDRAVGNILRIKFLLGLFDRPYVDAHKAACVQYAPEHLALARKAAEESAILLKNEGVLPLGTDGPLLVTGPLADAPREQLGTWVFDGDPAHCVTPLSALRERFPGKIHYVPGLKNCLEQKRDFTDVIQAARKARAVLAFVGEPALLSGEAHSLADLNLKGAQSDLLRALSASGKPVIAVVMAGRPLTLERDLPYCDALLYSFHPGTMGGEALTRLLTGQANPSGKTPVTFLRTVGQVPLYYNHNRTGRPYSGTGLLEDLDLDSGQNSLGHTSYYLDYGAEPLFPFGFGLSYTDFAYSNAALDRSVYAASDTLRISCRLENVGTCAGTEVVQVYVRDLVGSITRPVKELKHFERVCLDAGEARELQFRIPVSSLAFYGLDGTRKVESGDFQLWVGSDSRSGEALAFRIE